MSALDPTLAEAALDQFSSNLTAEDRGHDGPFAEPLTAAEDADPYTSLAAYPPQPPSVERILVNRMYVRYHEDMITVEQVTAWHAALLDDAGSESLDDDARVDLVSALQDVIRVATARQADLVVDLDASRRAEQARAGVPAARRGRGVAHQVALARRTSPHRGQVFLGLARALRSELPCTRDALRAGLIDEWTATLVCSETACLDPETRIAVDRAVLGDHDRIDGMGVRRLVAAVRAEAATADPAALVRRASNARADRHVSLRPAPDTMTWLTALVPVEQGVQAYAALKVSADSARAQGDDRSRGQLVCDLLVERLTGQTTADAVSVEVGLVMSDATLLAAGTEPASLIAPGVPTQQVPAQIAREITARALGEHAQAWIRRLYADPTGHLVALTSKQRFHRDGLAAYLMARDQRLCRTPWCDAPVRHLDHPTSAADGTDALNGHGLCEACNHAKQAPGWRHQPVPPDQSESGRHRVDLTTPTGHHHRSTAPPLPAPAPPRRLVPMLLRVDIVYDPTAA